MLRYSPVSTAMTTALALGAVLSPTWAGAVDATEGGAPMPEPTAVLSLAFDETPWAFEASGHYLLVEDPRGLRQVFHPWEVSADGDCATLTATVAVPADWTGPIFLNLYAGDTYVSEGWKQAKPTWWGACHNFVGHRFKQALVDGAVVWEQDVGDAEEFGYVALDISGYVRPGASFELSLRVLDKVGSATKLPGDEFFLHEWSWSGRDRPDAQDCFYIRVFWGDVALSAGAPVAWERNPARRWPKLDPVRLRADEPAALATGELRLDCPAALPEDGYPVTWGIPFAEGVLLDAANVRLSEASGAALPLQTTVLRRWPDGSINWLLLDFQASAADANRALRLTYGTQVVAAPPASGLRVEESSDGVRVDTGALSFVVRKGAQALAEGFTLAGEAEPLGTALSGVLRARERWAHPRYVPVNESVTVEAGGPERATVLCAGRLVADERVFGRFTCRIHAYRGKPYVRVLYRIFNDTDTPAQLVDEWSLSLATPIPDGEVVIGDLRHPNGPQETDRLFVRQAKADAYTVFEGNDTGRAAGVHWSGPVTLQAQGRGVSGAVRHFAQLYPKRMWAGLGGQIVFDLFARTIEYEQYVMTPGEARRHELLLFFHRGAPDEQRVSATFAAFQAPPILLSPEWYGRNQAFGRGAAISRETLGPLYDAIMAPQVTLECTQPLGLRNWPDGYSDSVISAYRGVWMNNYQEPAYGAVMLATLGGRREMWDWAEALMSHFMDVDICHWCPDAQWIGASYGCAPYHTSQQPYALNNPLDSAFRVYSLTGDPDARETAVGIADWVCATLLGLGSTSARGIGWPLRAVMIAYENTGDPKYLDVARQLAESGVPLLEPRRGFFRDMSLTWQYRGGGSGMNSILLSGLIRYWRATGDERVGQACANIAHVMAYEWQSPTEPGKVLTFDPLQQHSAAALHYAPTFFFGYELTGDTTFLRRGSEFLEGNPSSMFALSFYWDLGEILHSYALATALKRVESPGAHLAPARP